jgi:UDP-N-acetylmuramyl pentapeptide phosphotransferase/UDP-N-acetylglucosamine-1-phosphate transferase
MGVALGAATAALAATVCAGLIIVLFPLLQRYALAIPNARSSHKTPTPQGGGIAVVAATIAVGCAVPSFMASGTAGVFGSAPLFAAALVMAGIGVIADVRATAVGPRLALQALVIAALIYTLPPELRVVPMLPWWVERLLLVIGGVWFVNLVNFMDGLDWMTVAEVVPLTAALAVIGGLGILPPADIFISLALCGAMIGFAYFNRPVARLFLGDVGSLSIGLMLGWLLIVCAGAGGRAAAILLPLYYVADSTITLFRRAIKGERVWQAHRTHYYQRATDGGFSVVDVVGRVFAVNVILSALAIATVIYPSGRNEALALLGGVAIVAWLLVVFARGKR